MKLDSKFAGSSMYRQHTGNNYTIMVSKPPKPPSWRDFVPAEPPPRQPQPSAKSHSSSSKSQPKLASSGPKRSGSKDLEFTDLARIRQKSYSEGSDLSRLGLHSHSYQNLHPHMGHSHTLPNPHTSKSRKHHRSHGRLHRTRSQFIDQGDLPRIEKLHVSLAETKPKEFGLQRRADVFDPRLYLDENAKRCKKWLQQVHDSQPLEDVAFSKRPGVDIEIPEEGWDDFERLKATRDQNPNSGSGSEIDSASVCAANRPDLSEKEREAHIRLSSYSPTSKKCSSKSPAQPLASQSPQQAHAAGLEVLQACDRDSSVDHNGDSPLSTIAQVLSPPSPQPERAIKPNHRDKSKDSAKTSPKRLDMFSKENRHPVPRMGSSSSEISHGKHKKKGLDSKDVEHSGDMSVHQYAPGYISRDEDYTKDIKLNFNR